jgi:hypothetical protein
MGMMLRRNNRRGDYNPTVNGKPVQQEPKTRSLTKKKNTQKSQPTYTTYGK